MLSQWTFLEILAALFVAGFGLTGYAFGVEPILRMKVTSYRLTPPGWPPEFKLRIAVIADLHACDPWMTLARIQRIVSATNELRPDIILLLGDYVSDMSLVRKYVRTSDWSEVLSGLKAPLGVHAILGNHDWWEDETAQEFRPGSTIVRAALEDVGIAVYENAAVRIEKDKRSFWLAGLGDQLAIPTGNKRAQTCFRGVDDLAGTLAQITDDAPVILLVHEPDIFPQVPDRVSVTLAGHTHAGQVRLFGYSPIVPSRFGNRYAYGHVIEENRHMIISGGLGMSILPVRFGAPPELVLVEFGEA